MWRRVLLALLFMAGNGHAGQDSAFQAGKSLGETVNDKTFSGISDGAAGGKIPAYGTAPAETVLFQGGMGQPASAGVSKMQNCATGTPDPDPIRRQECEAVNFLARNPQVRPQFTITRNDPMMLAAEYARDNAEDILAQFGMNMNQQGSQSQCTTRTDTTPAVYETATCSVAREFVANQCVYGREVVIDADANYQCDQTVNAYETLKCRRSSSVTCTGGGTGCAPSGIRTDSVSISGFGRFLVHPASDGYWFVSAGTIAPDGSYINNSHFSGSFYDVYQSDIYFDITNKSNIATFFLDQILYDDNIAVWLNGHLIYHSTGGTDLSTCTYSIELLGVERTVIGVNDGVHACTRDYFEGGRNISNYGGVELKDKLVEGSNHVRIKVAVGKNGDAIIRFKTLAYCPLICSVSTNNQCAALEARAQ